MVKSAICICFLFVLSVAAEDSGSSNSLPSELPNAKELMPSSAELPSGKYRFPWKMGNVSNYKTEQAWRAENPPPHITIPKMAAAIRNMPEEQWSRYVSNTTESVKMSFMPYGLDYDPGMLVINAIVEDGTRAGVANALEASADGMIDSAVMEYIRVENPSALDAPAVSGQPPKIGSIIKLDVTIMLWSEAAISNRVNEFDFTAKEVENLVRENRRSYERTQRILAEKWCASLEEDLAEIYDDCPDNTTKINEILTDMISVSAARIEVTAKPLGVGDNAHVMRIFRSKLPHQPEKCQGFAHLRCGRAVVYMSYTVPNKYAAKYDAEIIDCLSIFESKLLPYRILPD